MMLTIDLCLMLSCLLVEKFYLDYALCDFDSISFRARPIYRSADICRPISGSSRYIVSLFTTDKISALNNYLKLFIFESKHNRSCL